MQSSSSHRFFSRKNIKRVYGNQFTDGNKVTLLWKGKDSFRIIFDALRKAQKFICLQFYIFRNDETGRELAEILKQKASEGIDVYILYDHFGSFGTAAQFWRELKDSGIKIRASHPFKWTSPLHYVRRDHRKLIIIDGSVAFTGGLNIANEYRGYHRLRRKVGWRDTGIFLEGPIAGKLLDMFKKSWKLWKGAPIRYTQELKPVEDGLPVIPIIASSAKGRRRMRKLLFYSINHAQERIYLTTAYFVPSRRMIQTLQNAVTRGVNVKLLVPGKPDVRAAHYAGRAFFTKLLKAGVEIYNYHGEVLHAKTAVFDGLWSIIGSANLDFQSLRRNDEGNVGIIDESFGRQMEKIFYKDMGKSEKISPYIWKKRPLYQKLIEHFFALFRRRL